MFVILYYYATTYRISCIGIKNSAQPTKHFNRPRPLHERENVFHARMETLGSVAEAE